MTSNDGVDLIGGSRDLLLSAACSLREPQPVYPAGTNREAADLLRQMRLGQTDQGSFVVTLLTPIVAPPMPALFPDPDDRTAPGERRMTLQLVEAVTAARLATERAAAGDNGRFEETVGSGVSANGARPWSGSSSRSRRWTWASHGLGLGRWRQRELSFVSAGRMLCSCARRGARFRERAPRQEVRLHGFVRLLKRGGPKTTGRSDSRLTSTGDGSRS